MGKPLDAAKGPSVDNLVIVDPAAVERGAAPRSEEPTVLTSGTERPDEEVTIGIGVKPWESPVAAGAGMVAAVFVFEVGSTAADGSIICRCDQRHTHTQKHKYTKTQRRAYKVERVRIIEIERQRQTGRQTE